MPGHRAGRGQQAGLGAIPAFDIAAVCSGFVYGLAVAAGLIALGSVGQVLVIGADAYSTDSSTRPTALLARCSATAPARWSCARVNRTSPVRWARSTWAATAGSPT